MRHSLNKHGCFLLTKEVYFQNLCWNGGGGGGDGGWGVMFFLA